MTTDTAGLLDKLAAELEAAPVQPVGASINVTSVRCIIEVEDVAYVPRKPYEFSVLPRIGEHVALEWDGEKYPKFTVYDVLHVPDEVEDRPAFVVLYVRRVDR